MSVEIIMYSTRFCPYCMRERRLLKNKGVSFKEISVGGNQALWAEMEQRSNRNTVPQIFIEGKSVGGFDDIAALNQAGELNPLLGILT